MLWKNAPTRQYNSVVKRRNGVVYVWITLPLHEALKHGMPPNHLSGNNVLALLTPNPFLSAKPTEHPTVCQPVRKSTASESLKRSWLSCKESAALHQRTRAIKVRCFW